MSLFGKILNAVGLTTEAQAFETYVDFRMFVRRGDAESKAVVQRKLKLAIETAAANDDAMLSSWLDDIRQDCLQTAWFK